MSTLLISPRRTWLFGKNLWLYQATRLLDARIIMDSRFQLFWTSVKNASEWSSLSAKSLCPSDISPNLPPQAVPPPWQEGLVRTLSEAYWMVGVFCCGLRVATCCNRFCMVPRILLHTSALLVCCLPWAVFIKFESILTTDSLLSVWTSVLTPNANVSPRTMVQTMIGVMTPRLMLFCRVLFMSMHLFMM